MTWKDFCFGVFVNIVADCVVSVIYGVIALASAFVI